MNVLVIDNDPALVRSLDLLLSAEGHQVKTFTDGPSADDFVEEEWRPDVAIVDYVIPPVTAHQILERLRSWLPRDCRLILISGHSDLLDALTLAELGVDAFLPKPLDLDRLTKLITLESR